MSIPQDLVRVALNFTTVGDEIAVSTFMVKLNHEAGAATNWPQMTQDLAQKTYEAWQSAWGNSAKALYFPPWLVLRDVSTYHLDSNTGHTIDKGAYSPAANQVWHGTSDTPSMPLEASVAVSLYGYAPGSFVADRARKRGRMYLPPMATVALTTDAPRAGRLSIAAHQAVGDTMGAFFNDMQGKSVGQDPLNIGQTWELVVLSRLGGYVTSVQAVRVGDVIDTQRRRRNKLTESYRDTTITR